MNLKADLIKNNYINTQNIFKIIRSSTGEPVFKAEISRLTGLSIPTVMRITDDLSSKQLVRAVGKGESNGGKPPQLLEFVGDTANIIGVDLATDYIRVICIDLNGNISYQYKQRFDINEGFEAVLGHITNVIKSSLEDCKMDKDTILGIGIAVPGILDLDKGIIVYSPDFGWENVEIIKHLKKDFGVPVYMENDSRAKACGELWYGLAKNVNNFVCINYGYGIGSAFVFDGKIYKGNLGIAGELGHVILDRKGEKCDCGNYGCTEALASGNSIVKTAKHLAFGGSCRKLLKMAGSIENIDDKIVFQAAAEGDEESIEIIDQSLEYLGFAIANVVTLLDPGMVIIENYYYEYRYEILSKIQSVVERYMMQKIDKKVQIVLSEFGEYDGCIGAAAILFEKWSDVGFNKHLL